MKSFSRYLVPSIITTLILSCYAIVDGIFIGQSVGDSGLSAINLAWPITGLIQCVGTGLGLSGGILISYYKGLNQIDKSNKLKLTTIILIAIIGVLLGSLLLIFAIPILRLFQAEGELLDLSYEYIRVILIGSVFQMLGVGLVPLLKNSGKTIIALIASLVSIFINLLFDYIFIMVLNYGLWGAALASVMAQASAFLICFIAYFKELKGIDFKLTTIKEIFLGSIAPIILNYSYSIAIIITNACLLLVSDNESVAAYTLLSYLLYVAGALSLGVGDAIQPLFSFNYAKGDNKSNFRYLKKCYIIAFILTVVVSLILFLIRYPLSDLYNLGEKAMSYFNAGLIPYLLGFLFIPFIKVSSSYLYSIEKKSLANLLVLLEPVIFTPLIYSILIPIFRVNGIWYGYLVIQLIVVVFAIIFIVKTNRSLKKEVSML